MFLMRIGAAGAERPHQILCIGLNYRDHAAETAGEREARAAIAGYVLVNDVSQRAFQFDRGGQWSKGRSAETFDPAGPWLQPGDVVELGIAGLGRQRQTVVPPQVKR